ncbi:MAG: ATP-grasp domain-containing protein [Nanoarchaeota archaeon]|nr:ATP-grasp domain-containing protein [Nanoarchaeota archaeon]
MTSKKSVIGFLYSGKNLGKEEKMFLELAKKKNIELIPINIFKRIDEKEFREQIKKCDLIYNNTAEDFVIEYIKTIEEFGKKVIDNSRLYYYTEDKWMFYVKCQEHNIPTINTILLSENLNIAKKELEDFNHWPVVLKRVVGTMGEYVEKAENPEQAVRVIKKFWKKGSEKIPIIAQEMVLSPSYRITIINKKIVQTAIKTSKTWKATGVHGKTFKKFKIDSDLKKIVDKVVKAVKINICGIDLLKKDGKWLVLEVNSEPAFDFFENEREKLVDLTLNFLKQACINQKNKKAHYKK